ncbi:MAG: hypothetical protein ACKOXM_00900 [Agromyces sp.]
MSRTPVRIRSILIPIALISALIGIGVRLEASSANPSAVLGANPAFLVLISLALAIALGSVFAASGRSGE